MVLFHKGVNSEKSGAIKNGAHNHRYIDIDIDVCMYVYIYYNMLTPALKCSYSVLVPIEI